MVLDIRVAAVSRDLHMTANAAAAVDVPLDSEFTWDGSTSDLAQQFYARHKAGDKAPRLGFSTDEVPEAIQKRLKGANLQFQDLPGLLQRALVWDTGFALSINNEFFEIQTKKGVPMSELAVSTSEFASLDCATPQNCTQPDASGTMWYKNNGCAPSEIFKVVKCAVMKDLDENNSERSMWSTGGDPSAIPAMFVRIHKWEFEGEELLVNAIHTLPENKAPLYGKCGPSISGADAANGPAYGSITIPCYPFKRVSSSVAKSFKTPEHGSIVKVWLEMAKSETRESMTVDTTTAAPNESAPVSGAVRSSAPTLDGGSTANTSGSNDKKNGFNLSVWGPVIAGIVMVAALVAFVLVRRRRRSDDDDEDDDDVSVVSMNGGIRRTRGSTQWQQQQQQRGGYTANSPQTYHIMEPSPAKELYPVGGRVGSTESGTKRSSLSGGTRSAGREWTETRGSVGTGTRGSVGSAPRSSMGTGGSYARARESSLWDDPVLQAVRIPLDRVELTELISRGAYGEVYLGEYKGHEVAVKRLLPERRKDMKEIDGFISEIKLQAGLEHECIVRFIGVAWDSLADLCMVTEFMMGGDLRSALTRFESEGRSRGFDQGKLRCAKNIAHALTYMHSLQPVVLHRDLKSRNILLTDMFEAKLTDFGVSRERADTTMTSGVGTSLWMAPEVMLGGRYDEKADVFSFGVVLSELDTHQLPYSQAKESGSGIRMPDTAILQMVSLGRLSVTFSRRADPDVVALGRECVAVDPRERPTAAQVLYRLHQIMRAVEF